MLPVPSAFSIPPIRCSSPGVPGLAQARADGEGVVVEAAEEGLDLLAAGGDPDKPARLRDRRAGADMAHHHGNAGCDQSQAPDCRESGSEQQMLKEIQQFYPGRVVAAHDLDVF